jgi:prepilin-type N-terminal cleavage/methylation domain-containing protein
MSTHMTARPRAGDRPNPGGADRDPRPRDRESHRRVRSSRDSGFSLIEVLISIVLIGTVISATLTTLQVTIRASGTDRDHSNAHAWLQTAADVLYARPLEPCGPADGIATNKDAIISTYEATLQQTENPEDWPDTNIEIYDLQFWHINIDPVTKFTEEGWGDLCDTSDTNLQRIGIEVRSDSGEIVEQVEVIIGE